MIARGFILFGVFQLTVCVGAQVTGIVETGATTDVAGGPGLEREWRNTIQNVGKKEIAALHVTLLCTTKDGRIHNDEGASMDALLQFTHEPPIRPGGSFVSKIIEKGDCTARTDAVVYANGDVEGDKDKIDLIFQLRSGAYKALPVVIPLLDEIASGSLSVAEVIQILQNRIGAISNNGAVTSGLSDGEIAGEGLAFGGAITLLQDHVWLRTSSDGTENRQPRVEELMRTKGISLEQAHAFVTANKYREWQSILEDHTTPPGEN